MERIKIHQGIDFIDITIVNTAIARAEENRKKKEKE